MTTKKTKDPTTDQYNRWLRAALPKNTAWEREKRAPKKDGGTDVSWQFAINACHSGGGSIRYCTDGYRAHLLNNSTSLDGDGNHAYDFDKLKTPEPMFVVYASAFHLREICKAALALVKDDDNHPMTICFGPDKVTASATGTDGELQAEVKDGDEWSRYKVSRGLPHPDPIKFVYEPQIDAEWKFKINARYLHDALAIFGECDKVEICAGKYGKPIEIRPKYQENISCWPEALIVPLKA